MKGKLQEYAFIAEIISSVAIVASLIFVGAQIQQNTVATQGSTRNQLIAADLDVLFSPDAPQSSVTFRSPEPITAEEVMSGIIYLTGLLRVREFVWLQYREGLVDYTTWQAYLSGIGVNFNHPRARMYWEEAKIAFDPEFVAEVDKYLVNVPTDQVNFFDMEALMSGQPR